MTRTELLALADFVAQFSGTQYDGWASDLRKLAALEPVAWRIDAADFDAEWWATVKHPHHPSLPLFDLTGVIDHE